MKQRDHYRQILRLVSRIGRMTNPQHLPVLKQMRIPLTQFLALDALSDAGGPLRMTELAHAAGLSPSELTRVVAELEGKEWVERGADPEDSRVRLVEATPAGARLIKEVHSQATAELRGVWSDFTHDEWHGFIDYLQRFEQGLCRVRAKRKQSAPSRRRDTAG
jgi:DNA-binding MarR family transcriptional regulator